MMYLISGLVLFLGVHSVRIVAEDWRNHQRLQWGANVWRAAYSLLSLAGLALIIWGFGQAQQQPVLLWMPPIGLRHLAILLTLPAFVLLAAAHVPGNRISARVHHPLTLSVKFWALAHLMANGMLSHVLLFGSFLLWAVLAYASARRRDAASPPVPASIRKGATGVTVAIGVALWMTFTLWLHGLLMGVRPFG